MKESCLGVDSERFIYVSGNTKCLCL